MSIEDGLDSLLLGRYDEALTLFERCPMPQAKKLRRVARVFAELASYAADLARGNLSASPPGPDNLPAAGLKSLHSKLKRLDRQLFMASTGYPVSTIDYLGDLSERLDYLVGQTLLHKKQTEDERDLDAETGLLNRRSFIRRIYDVIRMRRDKVGVLFCCSLDNIKYINDTHGYDCGDLYIGKVVDVLRSCEGGVNLLARVGGNEFAVYAHGFDTEESACDFARGNLETLSKTRVALPHEEIKIRASCGFAVYPNDATASDVLMNYASHAMFEVQNLNRGTIMRFSPEIYRTKAAILGRQERLDELLEEKLIRFAFQPIVCLRNGAINGYEALMRPMTADFAGPLDVLSLAESQSKLRQLEKLTFDLVFSWIFRNLKRLGERKVFFNTISTQYLDSAELRKIHPEYALISKNMVFEILETASVESTLLHRVNRLRKELSVMVAIDDFGCGHSNAVRLINISPDILKIDRFFINDINNAPASKKEFLSNILAYCRAKGIRTVAEGVETYEELADIMRMGFDYAQGFYLGRPEFQPAELDQRVQAEIAALAERACHADGT